MKGKVVAVNRAEKRGIPKRNVGEGYLQEGWGLVGDAHAGEGDRQISILPLEAMELVPPTISSTIEEEIYTENITIEGIPLNELSIGRKLRIGEAEVLICHIGKERFKELGRSYIVSREGRFGKVIRSGRVKVGDAVIILGEG
ncbi:MAG: MOSC domain-containing protein [Deltaproteobacteria bacterium]|nr:MAG: MOSC domain-containing protein [Deltaproteobacteria bacterium]